MGYRNESKQYEARPPRRGRCLLSALVVLLVLVGGGALLLRYVVRPMVTQAIQDRIAQSMPGGVLPDPNTITLPPTDLAPEDVPPGPITVSEAAANDWIQENRQQLQGLDQVVVHFVPGGVSAEVTAGGVTSTAQAEVTVENGRIVAVNPRLGPPLNLVVDIQPFAQLLQNRLNQDLATLNRRVSRVDVTNGEMTIILE